MVLLQWLPILLVSINSELFKNNLSSKNSKTVTVLLKKIIDCNNF